MPRPSGVGITTQRQSLNLHPALVVQLVYYKGVRCDMVQWLNQFSVETLIGVPMVVVGGIYLATVEIKSWIKKGHSALF